MPTSLSPCRSTKANRLADDFTQLNEKFIKARRDYEALLESSMAHPPQHSYHQYAMRPGPSGQGYPPGGAGYPAVQAQPPQDSQNFYNQGLQGGGLHRVCGRHKTHPTDHVTDQQPQYQTYVSAAQLPASGHAGSLLYCRVRSAYSRRPPSAIPPKGAVSSSTLAFEAAHISSTPDVQPLLAATSPEPVCSVLPTSSRPAASPEHIRRPRAGHLGLRLAHCAAQPKLCVSASGPGYSQEDLSAPLNPSAPSAPYSQQPQYLSYNPPDQPPPPVPSGQAPQAPDGSSMSPPPSQSHGSPTTRATVSRAKLRERHRSTSRTCRPETGRARRIPTITTAEREEACSWAR